MFRFTTSERTLYDKIDEKLLELVDEYEKGLITATELAIKSGKTVKVNKKKI